MNWPKPDAARAEPSLQGIPPSREILYPAERQKYREARLFLRRASQCVLFGTGNPVDVSRMVYRISAFGRCSTKVIETKSCTNGAAARSYWNPNAEKGGAIWKPPFPCRWSSSKKNSWENHSKHRSGRGGHGGYVNRASPRSPKGCLLHCLKLVKT